MITKKTTLAEIERLSYPCSCKACSNGCNFGSGSFTNDQIPNLAVFLGISEPELKEKYLETITKFNTTRFRPKIERKEGKPYGKCIFFRENRCQIHEVKPLECKLAMGCKDYGEELSLWFMLKEFVNEKDKKSMADYGQYLKAGGKTLKN